MYLRLVFYVTVIIDQLIISSNVPAYRWTKRKVEKMIVEISGVKLDIDERTAKTVESYRVGDAVKVLIKQYTDTWESCPGVIVGFAAFKNRPGIEVLYLSARYSSAEVKFALLTAESKDIEIAPMSDYEVTFDRAGILERIDNEIQKGREAVRRLETKRAAFDKFFGNMAPEG